MKTNYNGKLNEKAKFITEPTSFSMCHPPCIRQVESVFLTRCASRVPMSRMKNCLSGFLRSRFLRKSASIHSSNEMYDETVNRVLRGKGRLRILQARRKATCCLSEKKTVVSLSVVVEKCSSDMFQLDY